MALRHRVACTAASSGRRRRPGLSALHLALAPDTPLRAAETLDLQLREHVALDALTKGAATAADLVVLRTSATVARALCAVGYGHDELPTVAAVEQALDTDGLAGGRAAAVRALLELHDGQRMAVTVRDYAHALAFARRLQRR